MMDGEADQKRSIGKEDGIEVLGDWRGEERLDFGRKASKGCRDTELE